MKRIAVAALLSLLTMGSYIPTDAERARWTMFDMRSWKTALDAYKSDHNAYPAAKTLQEARAAIEPVYILHAPMNDAWGDPYRVESTPTSFRIVSAGADGVFQPDTSATGKLTSFNDDAVATEAGHWLLRYWEMK